MEPVVLLPGMMCDARLWWPQLCDLSRDRAVHLGPLTTADRVSDLAVEILAAAPDQFALAGLAMGGNVAMEVIRRAPDRVTRIALLDTNPLPETPSVAAGREPQIARVRAGRLDEVIREEAKPNYFAPGPRRAEILDLAMDMALGLGGEVFVAQSRAMQRRLDQQATLRRIAVPALVLCGEHDQVNPVRRHELMADLIPHSELVVVADAGHFPTLEQPEATTWALRHWLES